MIDNTDNPVDWNTVLNSWMTIQQAADTIGMSHNAVRSAINRKKLRAIKVGGRRSGEWRIDPDTVKHYRKRKKKII